MCWFAQAQLHVTGGAVGGGRMVDDASAITLLDTGNGAWGALTYPHVVCNVLGFLHTFTFPTSIFHPPTVPPTSHLFYPQLVHYEIPTCPTISCICYDPTFSANSHIFLSLFTHSHFPFPHAGHSNSLGYQALPLFPTATHVFYQISYSHFR